MRIIFGVFDWGLGHATRDAPLIDEMLKRGHSVDILTTGRALALLKNRFRNRCCYFDVPSIVVPYPKNSLFVLNFARKIPKMLADINRARELSSQIIKSGSYDVVISDCRYDVYDKVTNSYLINHQLRFDAPPGIEQISEKWLAERMKKYRYIIVPDFDKDNLSGRLSHNLRYFSRRRIKYIGILSQAKKKKVKEDIDYFIPISGPEPQRTIFEKKILKGAKSLRGKIVIALGRPEIKISKSKRNMVIYGFLDSKKQEEMMNRAKFIITRSGYTTVMEIAELGKKNVLFVPTPGQTEQEYLADLYEEKGYFHHVHQDNIDLLNDIKKSTNLRAYNPPWRTEESIKKFMEFVGIK